MTGDIIRQVAESLLAVAAHVDRAEPLKEVLDRLDRDFPHALALSPADMHRYWGVSEAVARTRMHAADFPAEVMPGRITVSKVALALYEIRRAGRDGKSS